MTHSNYVVILVTAKDHDEAQAIAQGLLDRKLIACANIVPKVESWFTWQGKTDKADEALLVIKSRQDLFPGIEAAVKALHSYEVPEVIALPIVAGSRDYLNWIDETTQA